jgi:hypothetical protein
MGKEGFQEHDWVEIVDKFDEAWFMILKHMSKQCQDKVDKMQKTYNKTNIDKHKCLQMGLV